MVADAQRQALAGGGKASQRPDLPSELLFFQS
jgi:hypothetical protein